MNEVWNLNSIYTGFDDPAFEQDLVALKEKVAGFAAFTASLETVDPMEGLRSGIAQQEEIQEIAMKLGSYASLRQAADTRNPEAGSHMGRVMAVLAGLAAAVLMVLVAWDCLGSTGIHPAALLGIAEPKAWAADWLDFFDMLSEGIMMPLGALLMCIMIGYEIGPDVVRDEVERSGVKMKIFGFFKLCVKFITPILMVLVLYGQIKDFFL